YTNLANCSRDIPQKLPAKCLSDACCRSISLRCTTNVASDVLIISPAALRSGRRIAWPTRRAHEVQSCAIHQQTAPSTAQTTKNIRPFTLAGSAFGRSRVGLDNAGADLGDSGVG